LERCIRQDVSPQTEEIEPGIRWEFAHWGMLLNEKVERNFRHLPVSTPRQTGFKVFGWQSWNSADVLTTSPMMGDDPVSVAFPGSGCKALGYDAKASTF
jgi:hypothetical protein